MSADLYDEPPYSAELNARLDEVVAEEAAAVEAVNPADFLPQMLDVTLPQRNSISELDHPVRVSRDFFVNAVNAAWVLHLRGESVSAARIQASLPNAFSVSDLPLLDSVVLSEKFRVALLSRGIEPGRNVADGLSAEMVACIRALTGPEEGLSVRQRLRGAGVTWEQYQGWLNFGPFRETLTKSSERGLRSSVALANAKLLENVDSGDLKAIQYVHELTGYFTPGKQQQLDAQQMVRDVMSVVLRRVTDTDTLMALAADFRVLQEQLSAGVDPSRPQGVVVSSFGEEPVILDELEGVPNGEHNNP
jgi:hypothetical protein